MVIASYTISHGGSYAEYALAPQSTTAHLPAHTSFEEAAAIPLAALTAVVGLYRHLALPQPWTPVTSPTPLPLVIYGAASAVGIYAVQLAARANIHPLICVAGHSQDYLRPFLDPTKGDVVVDYRAGDEAVVKGIHAAVPQGVKLLHAYDAVSEKGSDANLIKVLSPGAVFTTVLPTSAEETPVEGIRTVRTMVSSVHAEDKELGYVYMRYFALGLHEGWFKGQRQEVVPGGLGGVQTALQNLKDGKANAVKYVFRIEETK